MTEKVTVDPKGLCAIRLSSSVVLEHELGADPAVFRDDLLRFWQEGITPEFCIRGNPHLMPVAVKIPFAGRRPARPVAPWFERGGEAFMALGAQACPAKAAPFVATAQTLVRPQS